MRRFLKWILVGSLGLLSLMVLLLLGILGTGFVVRHRIVNVEPGQLKTKAAPLTYGQAVNPFIGTGGYPWMCGQNCPGPSLPFGVMRLGPETASVLVNHRGFNSSGYYYGDNKIVGFSHTRLIGTGAWDGGNCLVVPTLASNVDNAWREGQYIRFSHAKEKAFPGYYAVHLPAIDVLAELTATEHVGAHRYTFKSQEEAHILIDAAYVIERGTVDYVDLSIAPEARELSGEVQYRGTFSGRFGGSTVYFVAQFDQPFSSYGLWEGDSYQAMATEATGAKAGADFAFASVKPGEEVNLKLAISYVSLKNARENLRVEATGKDFDQILAEAQQSWEEHLDLIALQGGSQEQRTMFYTALYRTLQMPTVYNDVNGEYKGFDKKIHRAEGFRYFTDMSLWDTFRNVHSIYMLILPQDQRDMMVSLVKMAEQGGGALPRWPSGHGYTGSMIGSPADITITESYLKGIQDFDVASAYESMRNCALNLNGGEDHFNRRGNMDVYREYGYLPADKASRSVAKTLEFAYADYCISLLAEALGHHDDARIFAKQGQFYRNLWNPESRYFHARYADGSFQKAFKPKKLTFTDYKSRYTEGYVEGTPLQWRYAVPFDAPGLIGLFDSTDHFVEELNDFFAKANSKRAHWHPGSYYWHGNEPDIYAAYLFNEAGRPDLTQKWARWVMDTKYGTRHEGLDGNDDGATLSAWYVFSALGFYPLAGTTKYQLGTPLFEQAEIKMGEKTLRIVAENYAPERFYVKQVRLNGRVLEKPWFFHEDIAQGGELRFEMSDAPPTR